MGLADLYLTRGSMVFGGVEAKPEDSIALIVGIPYDATSSFRPGSRFAPQAIRNAATNIEFYSLRAMIDVDDYRIGDLGDIYLPLNPRDALRRIEDVAYELAEQYSGDKLLVFLGGEHTITIATFGAIKRKYSDTCFLVFDAHFDLRNQYMEDPFSHACVLRRIVEKYGSDKVFVVGVRAFTREEIEYANSAGIRYLTSHSIRLLGLREAIDRIKRWLRTAECSTVYVSIDMDVFDPAYAPGVGNPEPEGLEPWQVFDILFKSIKESNAKIIAADIVEVSPPHDCSGITSILAARTAVELIALHISSKHVGGDKPRRDI
ncbi:agmatinase [Pyrofollis japonicus]|uniref:agmatinase n=1 Tax=Pyrofollis japonicus TaxID=3060460 RepID=UPI00295AC833|nr:agmatinase [Pyrofollis japonicus]BEP18195.1 agmatinase [Pyrofollis japonicus]